MPDLDLARLREIAEKATGGPWSFAYKEGTDDAFVWANAGSVVLANVETVDHDAKFIATFNPTLALQLLDEIDQLKRDPRGGLASDAAEIRRLRSRIEELGRALTEASGGFWTDKSGRVHTNCDP